MRGFSGGTPHETIPRENATPPMHSGNLDVQRGPLDTKRVKYELQSLILFRIPQIEGFAKFKPRVD
jgi:hypothetical protein